MLSFGCFDLFFPLVTSNLRALSLMTIPEENSPLLDFKYNLYFYVSLLPRSVFAVDGNIALNYTCSFTFVMFCDD